MAHPQRYHRYQHREPVEVPDQEEQLRLPIFLVQLLGRLPLAGCLLPGLERRPLEGRL